MMAAAEKEEEEEDEAISFVKKVEDLVVACAENNKWCWGCRYLYRGGEISDSKCFQRQVTTFSLRQVLAWPGLHLEIYINI